MRVRFGASDTPVESDPGALLGRVAELSGRATEIATRMQQDAQLLTDVQQELSNTLSRLWGLLQSAPPAANPTVGPQVLPILEVAPR